MDIPPKISWYEAITRDRLKAPTAFPTYSCAQLEAKCDSNERITIKLEDIKSYKMCVEDAEALAMRILQVCETVREGLNGVETS